MTVSQFLLKWRQADLTERSGAQQHFCDLCELFGHPKPAEADPTGETFTFEKGAAKHGGGDGWADVWKRDFFAWEYKGRHKDLDAAYDQLLKYREALDNPPILAVCDMDRILVHTNFTASPAKVYDIRLLDFQNPDNLEILRLVFHDPARLKPGATREAITRELRERWLNPPEWVEEEILEFPGTVDGPWARYIQEEEEGCRLSVIGCRGANSEGPRRDSLSSPSDPENRQPKTDNRPRIGLVRYPRLVPRAAACAQRLKKRTLTNLYNERPTWLALAHEKLDAAVFGAYGWEPGMSDEDILEKLLALNLERSNQEG